MNLDLLVDLYKTNPRQGPGGDQQTVQALRLAELFKNSKMLQIADIGCGTGASTMVLAKNLNAKITAVDLFNDFLELLKDEAKKQKIDHRIDTLVCSMDQLPFKKNTFDVIWSEGAIYNIGFAKGIKIFRQFLKPGGILALSEITWLTQKRPDEIAKYWQSQYPEIATATQKIRVLERQGFVLKGYFALPETCWIENYYNPLKNSFGDFLSKHPCDNAKLIVESEKKEMSLYQKFRAYYGYGFYIARKI
ncbi:MAG: class I SAM-dependent methyltransferase [Pseudomonadota bacterium]